MSERRVYVIEVPQPDGSWRPVGSSRLENDTKSWLRLFPGSRVVPYAPIEETEEELEVYRLALRKACGAPSFIMTPPDPYHYVCRAREDIAAHKEKTVEDRKPHE